MLSGSQRSPLQTRTPFHSQKPREATHSVCQGPTLFSTAEPRAGFVWPGTKPPSAAPPPTDPRAPLSQSWCRRSPTPRAWPWALAFPLLWQLGAEPLQNLQLCVQNAVRKQFGGASALELNPFYGSRQRPVVMFNTPDAELGNRSNLVPSASACESSCSGTEAVVSRGVTVVFLKSEPEPHPQP